MPKFSIIVPVYNVAPYLCECLDSVLAQTFTDWEAICIDDGSTDGSGAILDEYATSDKRFHVIHQQNAGVGAARNAGLDCAKGEWICFVDGDDLLAPVFLEIFNSQIALYGEIKCFRVGFKKFYSKQEWFIVKQDTIEFKEIDISSSISMRDFSSYLFVCYAYKRELFDEVRFPGYVRGEDWCVLHKILLERVDRLVASEAQLYGYRQRPGSAMHREVSIRILCDEMDHRLDLMEMIDNNKKTVVYNDSPWLESYFTQSMYWISRERGKDKTEVVRVWRQKLKRIRHLKGISGYARFMSCTCTIMRNAAWDYFVCRVIPSLRQKNVVKRILRKFRII